MDSHSIIPSKYYGYEVWASTHHDHCSEHHSIKNYLKPGQKACLPSATAVYTFLSKYLYCIYTLLLCKLLALNGTELGRSQKDGGLNCELFTSVLRNTNEHQFKQPEHNLSRFCICSWVKRLLTTRNWFTFASGQFGTYILAMKWLRIVAKHICN